MAQTDMPLAGILPASDELVSRELSGDSYLKLEEDSDILQRAFKIFDGIFTD